MSMQTEKASSLSATNAVEGMAAGRDDGATLMSRAFGATHQADPSQPAKPVTVEEIERMRGLSTSNKVRGNIALGPVATIQHLPGDEPGLIAKFKVPVNAVITPTGTEKPRTAYEAKAYSTQWMPGIHGLQVANHYYRTQELFNPDALVTQPFIMCRYVEGQWVVAEVLQDNHPNTITGGVNLMRPGATEEDDAIPIVGMLSLIAEDGNKIFREDEGEKEADRKLDMLIEAWGKHIDPDPRRQYNKPKKYNYKEDDSLSGEDVEFIDKYRRISAGDPYSLAAPAIAWREYMRITTETRKKERQGTLTDADERLMSHYKDALRQEVLESFNVSIFKSGLLQEWASTMDMQADPIRWTAQMITPMHLHVFRALALLQEKGSDVAAQLYNKYAQQLGHTCGLLIKETGNNSIKRAMTYKSGQAAEVNPLGGELLYMSGNGDIVPVHNNLGSFPYEIFRSVADPTAPNQLHGILGVFIVEATAENNMAEDEMTMIIDGRLAPTQLVMGAMRAFAERQRLTSIGTPQNLLPTMPSIAELLIDTDTPPSVSIVVPTRTGPQVAAVLGRGSGMRWISRSDRHETVRQPTVLKQDPRPVQKEQSDTPTATPVQAKPKSGLFSRKKDKVTVLASTASKAVRLPDPTYTVVPNPSNPPLGAEFDDAIAISGMIVGNDPQGTVHVQLPSPEFPIATEVALNDRTRLRRYAEALREQEDSMKNATGSRGDSDDKGHGAASRSRKGRR